ncbi:high affinity copper uptake protein 1-like [Chelonus insularis]|uniref:high affinity copper uptake protein 1-like n=1 Tax=Chelonus insularis TaxID=460826 RepID=UPI00158ED86D|nr:high affinity copper uptake protein 1-like [Chelonus insularis]
MEMYFHFGVKENAILFYGWKTSDWQGIFGSAIGIVLFGIIYEGLKNYRENVYFKLTTLGHHSRFKESQRNSLISGVHVLQTILHIIQFVMGYFLMFIFMTFNAWLAIAVIIGIGLGYWLFAWDKYKSEDSECCT